MIEGDYAQSMAKTESDLTSLTLIRDRLHEAIAIAGENEQLTNYLNHFLNGNVGRAEKQEGREPPGMLPRMQEEVVYLLASLRETNTQLRHLREAIGAPPDTPEVEVKI